MSCQSGNDKSSGKLVIENNELLIYCENAMVPPLMELKTRFEENWGCKVTIHNDCAQNLVGMIQYSLKGDLFIPGSNAAFSKLHGVASPNLIDSVFIAYNPLVIMSAKGSKDSISGDLNSILNKNNAIILANPETSSLGYETRQLLIRENLYESVIDNVIALSADSKGLVNSLVNQEAQVVISWKSDVYTNKCRFDVDVYSIPESDINPPKIYVGLLSTSTNQILAQKFLDYASGETGLLIFKKYGFSQRKPMIF